jgi:hypothetical protein
MQDMEFTIQEGKLYVLQTRNGKRTAHAAVKIAVDMVNEKLIDKEKYQNDIEEQKNYLYYKVINLNFKFEKVFKIKLNFVSLHIGDIIDYITKKTGIKKLVIKLTNGNCGCEARRVKFNKWFKIPVLLIKFDKLSYKNKIDIEKQEETEQDIIDKENAKRREDEIIENVKLNMINKKFEKDASTKLAQYQTSPFEKSKRSIGEDMSFFQQQCNSNFTLISEDLKKKCKTFLKLLKNKFKMFFLNNNFLSIAGLLVTGIFLIIVGTVIFDNKTFKIMFNVLGGILLCFAIIKLGIIFLQDFGIIE